MVNDRIAESAADRTLTFAHLTDVHLTSPMGFPVREICNKRLLSYLSWKRHRRKIHDPRVLAVLTADLKASGAEHIAITGDLTHLGLSAECREALGWLRDLDLAERVSLIPGNHDRLIDAAWSDTVGLWRDFMTSDAGGGGAEDDFPFLRVRGPVAFIGLSSAVPTPPLMATGRLGAPQRDRLGQLLQETRQRDLFRVVLIHHPPIPGSYKWRKRLADDRPTAAVISEFGAELVLHGHTHRIVRQRLAGPGGSEIPVVGLASASSSQTSRDRTARYSLWRVDRGQDGTFQVSHRGRRYEHESASVVEDDTWNPLSDTC